MTFIQNQKVKKSKRVSKKLRIGLFISLIVVVVLGVVAYAYFNILPNQQDKQYLTAIKPAYNQQRAQMQLAYKSYSGSVFTSNGPTLAIGSQELASINAIITKANTLTGALSVKNNLNILPGTQNFKVVKATNVQYTAMQQYIDDSKTFLANYQAASKYVGQVAHIENSLQLATFFAELNTINQATTDTQLLSATTAATVDLGDAAIALHALNPPSDFQPANTSLSAKLNNANNALLDISSGITGEAPEQIANTIIGIDQVASPLRGLSNTTISSGLPTNPLLYEDILKLRGEHPLDN